MKTYEVSLWPSNQPPILLGYFKGKKKNIIKLVCEENELSKKDEKNLTIEENGPNSPMKRWNKS